MNSLSGIYSMAYCLA